MFLFTFKCFIFYITDEGQAKNTGEYRVLVRIPVLGPIRFLDAFIYFRVSNRKGGVLKGRRKSV